ncbi:hypothetical protein PVAP13_3KG206205 [Panicum virgatum]|uniref:SHSP domain-containing protein n=1 Tax=Panicum virgatum TaxID=38727 RepID=A0A8T0URN7_PANVG|nr:hypothetical protein PVAP13_3KG206205 [Panicum virgatum]
MASGRQATKPQQQAAEQDFDPKYEWQENDASFVLRLHLSGFRKEDFRVQVDGTGRLTVRGQRADGGKHSRFSKIFQLPAASNLDAITGRFDTGVLTLTVPRKVVDDAKPKEDPKEDASTTKKPPAAEQQVDAKRGKPEHEQPKATAPPATVKEEGAKPAAEAAAPPAADEKEAAPRPPQADAERKAVDSESLAAVTAKRRAEDERAKAAAAAVEAEGQRTHRGLRELVQELEGLAGSDWAEGLVETVKKNKEVIATAVAAFSLGLVASRLFCRN